jgi:hypothetical protein
MGRREKVIVVPMERGAMVDSVSIHFLNFVPFGLLRQNLPRSISQEPKLLG